ncbi:MAG: hypothetical protein ACLFSW_03255 [Halobacteriales archaeon]
MTRHAVKKQLDFFVNELIDGSLERFRPWGVLGPRTVPGNGILRVIFGSQIREEIGHYRVTVP